MVVLGYTEPDYIKSAPFDVPILFPIKYNYIQCPVIKPEIMQRRRSRKKYK